MTAPFFNKLVFDKNTERYVILRRALDEIKAIDLPTDTRRPMVLMKDIYDAIEFCLFFYEHNILPLIGEWGNDAVVAATAKQYNIDGLFTDRASLLKFENLLIGANLPIKQIAIIDRSFEKSDLTRFPAAKKDFILSLPETGPFAYLCDKTAGVQNIFHPYSDVSIEPGLAVISSSRYKLSPVEHYRTDIYLEKTEDICGCGLPSFVL